MLARSHLVVHAHIPLNRLLRSHLYSEIQPVSLALTQIMLPALVEGQRLCQVHHFAERSGEHPHRPQQPRKPQTYLIFRLIDAVQVYLHYIKTEGVYVVVEVTYLLHTHLVADALAPYAQHRHTRLAPHISRTGNRGRLPLVGVVAQIALVSHAPEPRIGLGMRYMLPRSDSLVKLCAADFYHRCL